MPAPARGMSAEYENRMVACVTLLPSVAILALLVAVPAVTVIGLSFTDSGLGDGGGAYAGWRNYAWVFRSGLSIARWPIRPYGSSAASPRR